MPRIPSRFALALLGALLCLAACAPTATVNAPPTPTATSTSLVAPTPTNVPVGWRVLATTYFSLAYPPDWTPDTGSSSTGQFIIWAPARQDAVTVNVVLHAQVPPMELTLYCQPQRQGARHTTLANLPMSLQLTGLAHSVRVWRFVNAQRTLYLLSVGDALTDAAIQARHEAIFATFRPTLATPWRC
ncbi:MAG TPA: hypothetical protein VFN78_11095 [Ktedonobacterales bacterium]|nr:hypothetical protein [Ktedonobacterales bacterium]